MAGRRRVRWDRVALILIPLILLIVFLCVQCSGGNRSGEESSRGKATLEGTAPEVTAVTGTEPAAAGKEELLVVIDAGHGGGDSGCTNGKKDDEERLEKDDNLRLALLVRDQLKARKNVRVIMTREDDTFLKLKERCDIANEANADLFVSLHRNAAANASGVEVWINSDSSSGYDNTIDYRLAGYILSWLEDVGISYNRGIRTGFRNAENGTDSDNYYVNRNTKMPSCLVEMGFMTSDIDNQNFDRRLNEYADAIASAIVEMSEDTGLLAEKKQPEQTKEEQ